MRITREEKKEDGARGHGWRTALHTVAFVLAAALSAGASCADDPPEWCHPEFCDDKGGGTVFHCKPPTGIRQTECKNGETEAAFWCQGMGGTAYPHDCKNYGDDTGGSGDTDDETGAEAPQWEPDAYIIYDARSDEFYVDATFIDELKADWSLLSLDDAYLSATESGYYELANVSVGNLSQAMGLKSGDLLLDVNGYDLGNLDNQITAYVELEDELEFVLTFERHGEAVRHTYVIVE